MFGGRGFPDMEIITMVSEEKSRGQWISVCLLFSDLNVTSYTAYSDC